MSQNSPGCNCVKPGVVNEINQQFAVDLCHIEVEIVLRGTYGRRKQLGSQFVQGLQANTSLHVERCVDDRRAARGPHGIQCFDQFRKGMILMFVGFEQPCSDPSQILHKSKVAKRTAQRQQMGTVRNQAFAARRRSASNGEPDHNVIVARGAVE